MKISTLFSRYGTLIFTACCLHSMLQVGCVYAQNKPFNEHYRNMVFKNTVSPNSAEFQKYVDVPVSPYTGTADISILLYNVTYGDINLPLTVSYHPSGIKVNEDASWIGLGWNLQAAGVISRKVIGLPDDLYMAINFGIGQDSHGLKTYGISFFENAGHLFAPNRIDQLPGVVDLDQISPTNYYRMGRGFEDTSPDIFYFNFAGYSGKFLFKEEGKVVNLTISDITIVPKHNHEKTIVGFDIITPEGLKYIFNAAELTKTYVSGAAYSNYEEGNFEGYNYWPLHPNTTYDKRVYTYSLDPTDDAEELANYEKYLGKPHYSSWKLTRIVNLSNDQAIDFSYSDEDIVVKSPDRLIQVAYSDQLNGNELDDHDFSKSMHTHFDYPHDNLSHVFDRRSSVSHSVSQISAKRLQQISWPGGRIEFVPGEIRKDMLPSGRHPGAHDVEFVANSRPLDQIRIYDYLDLEVKRWDFRTSYSEALGFNTSLPEVDKALYRRLRLNELIENQGLLGADPKVYSFSYDSRRLPNRISNRTDYWGYFNNCQADGFGFTKLWFYPNEEVSLEKPSRFSIYQDRAGIVEEFKAPVLGPKRPITSDRRPNEFAMAESLVSIDYPLGGKLILDYELNEYKSNGRLYPVGGLRLQFLLSQKSDNDIAGTVKYFTYKPASSHLINVPQFADHFYSVFRLNGTPTATRYIRRYFSTSQNELTTTHGSFIGYGEVEELTLYDGGFFSRPGDFPSEQDGLGDVLEYGRELNGYTKYVYSTPATFGVATEDYDPVTGDFIYKNSSTYFNGINDLAAVNRMCNSLYPFAPNPNYDWRRGKLLSKEVYRADGNILYRKFYTYDIKKYEKIPAAYITDVSWPYSGGFGKYYHLAGWEAIATETSIEYSYIGTVQKSLTTVNTYNYSSTRHKQLTSKQTVNSANEIVKESFYYPDDVVSNNSLPGGDLSNSERIDISKLNKDGQHRRSTIIQTNIEKDNMTLHRERTLYKTQDNSLVEPFIIQASKGNATLDTRVKFLRYDDMGNVLEASLDNDTPVSYIYGYQDQYIIAQMVNASYRNMPGDVLALVSIIKTTSNTEDNANKEATLRSLLDDLRNHSYLQDAQITTYTYDPMVGATSITDPNGQTNFYTYNGDQQLIMIKDSKGNIIAEYEYNIGN